MQFTRKSLKLCLVCKGLQPSFKQCQEYRLSAIKPFDRVISTTDTSLIHCTLSFAVKFCPLTEWKWKWLILQQILDYVAFVCYLSLGCLRKTLRMHLPLFTRSSCLSYNVSSKHKWTKLIKATLTFQLSVAQLVKLTISKSKESRGRTRRFFVFLCSTQGN